MPQRHCEDKSEGEEVAVGGSDLTPETKAVVGSHDKLAWDRPECGNGDC